MEILNFVYYFLIVTAMLFGLIRFIRGPDSLNRIIAFDLIAICVIGIVILYSIQEKSNHYIEMILIFCILGFASTVAFMESLFRSLKNERKNE